MITIRPCIHPMYIPSKHIHKFQVLVPISRATMPNCQIRQSNTPWAINPDSRTVISESQGSLQEKRDLYTQSRFRVNGHMQQHGDWIYVGMHVCYMNTEIKVQGSHTKQSTIEMCAHTLLHAMPNAQNLLEIKFKGNQADITGGINNCLFTFRL